MNQECIAEPFTKNGDRFKARANPVSRQESRAYAIEVKFDPAGEYFELTHPVVGQAKLSNLGQGELQGSVAA